jgi:hypothetical protein
LQPFCGGTLTPTLSQREREQKRRVRFVDGYWIAPQVGFTGTLADELGPRLALTAVIAGGQSAGFLAIKPATSNFSSAGRNTEVASARQSSQLDLRGGGGKALRSTFE